MLACSHDGIKPLDSLPELGSFVWLEPTCNPQAVLALAKETWLITQQMLDHRKPNKERDFIQLCHLLWMERWTDENVAPDQEVQ